MTVYTPNTPQVNEDPTTSQPLFLANFQKINSDFSQNHIAYTAGANNGFHTKIFFPTVLGSDPNLASPSSSVYPKSFVDLFLVRTTNELFFQNGTAAANVTQLTNCVVNFQPALNPTQFAFKLANGIIVNCGSNVAAGTPRTFPVGYQYTVQPFGAWISPTGINDRFFIQTLDTTHVVFGGGGALTVAYWLVIGK